MKIKDLIKELQKHNKEDDIFFSSDEEGNSISKSATVSRTLTGQNEQTKEDIVEIIIYPSGDYREDI